MRFTPHSPASRARRKSPTVSLICLSLVVGPPVTRSERELTGVSQESHRVVPPQLDPETGTGGVGSQPAVLEREDAIEEHRLDPFVVVEVLDVDRPLHRTAEVGRNL